MVDTVVVMTDGYISEIGSYDELLSHDGAFAQFLKAYLTQKAETEEDEEDEDPESRSSTPAVLIPYLSMLRDRHGRERMVVGFTSTHAICVLSPLKL